MSNAANAQLSTGPRTEEGKKKSSQNARTHGLTAQNPVISDQERAAFEQLHEQLHAETRPQGTLQQIIFEELVHAAWNLRRVRTMETDLEASELDRLARHHTRIERAFYRSLRELKALQTDAALTMTLPPDFMKIAPPLASRSQIAKRTQFLATKDHVLEADEYFSGQDLEEGALGRVLRYHIPEQTASTMGA
jgi:hypothetical protein